MSVRLSIISNHTNSQAVVQSNEKSLPKYLKDPLDFLKLNELLTPDQNNSRIAMRKILENEVSPKVSQYIEEAKFPFELIPKLRAAVGLKKLANGYKPLTMDEININLIELGRIDASLATFYGVNIGLVAYSIERFGNEEQIAKYVPALWNLDLIGCWGLTEPNFGSDASSLMTLVTPVEGGFEITGEKRWTGNASISDIMVIWARNTVTKEIQGFIVPTKSKGVRIENIERKLSFRIMQNGHIYMNKVFVPSSERLPKATDFMNGPNAVLEHSRISIPWLAVGMMVGVYEHCAKYMNERIQFGAPLAAYQLNQEKLVRILGHIQGSFLLVWKIDKLRYSDSANIAQASLIKCWISNAGREVTKLGREIFGGNGIIIDNYVIKAMADMEAFHTYEGTYDVNVLVAGRAITGIAAFKSTYKTPKKAQNKI